MIANYPFRIINFHCDNGSEYINQKVVEMLNKLLIKLTKSRPRHTNDNALIETKNGWVVRKWLGYSHISKEHAS
jgi:transposase InsO family protein